MFSSKNGEEAQMSPFFNVGIFKYDFNFFILKEIFFTIFVKMQFIFKEGYQQHKISSLIPSISS